MATNDEIGYLVYPEIDGDYKFPPEVRQAIADSPEIQAETMELLLNLIATNPAVRQELESLYVEQSHIIDGGTP